MPSRHRADVPEPSTPGRARLSGSLLSAVAAISSAALVILLADPLDPTVIAAGRVAVTGVALTILAGRGAALVWRAAIDDRAVRDRMVLASALLALHFGAWIASLTMTTVVRSVTLVATQPLFAGVVGRLLGDRAPWSLFAGGAVAVGGTALMLVGDGTGSEALAPNLGDALALLAAAAAAGYLAVGRSLRERLPLSGYLGAVHLLAAAMLVAYGLSTQITWVPAAACRADLLAVLYLGLVPGVIGHGLLNWAVRHLPVHVVSLAIVLEPIGAAALAVIVLGRHVTTTEVIGAAIVLSAVAIGVRRRRRISPPASG